MSVRPHSQRFSHEPRRGREKLKEAFSPRLLPFLASSAILFIANSWCLNSVTFSYRIYFLFTKDEEIRDREIDDGNQQCWFEFWIKGFEYKFTELYNIHRIGTFDTRKAKSYQYVLKLNSLFGEIQRILTHCMRDFKGFFLADFRYVFASSYPNTALTMA